MVNIKRLRFSELEKMLINAVLNRLDQVIYGEEFQIKKAGDMVQVIAYKSETVWCFPSREYLLGHFNALHTFTDRPLLTLK